MSAEPVRINKGAAHGFMFNHNGACFVALPAHAVRHGARVEISTAEPVRTGMGLARLPFWDGVDLAIVTVQRGLSERCDEPSTTLTGTGLDPATGATGDIVFIRDTGQVDRFALRVTRTAYLDFEAEFLAESVDDEVFAGLSGSFLMIEGRPSGMALTKRGARQVRFMRIEEVALNIGRWLSEGGRAPFRPGPEAAEGEGLPLVLADAQTPSIDSETMAENLLGPGAYVFQPHGPVEIVLDIRGEEAMTIRRILMTSDSSAGYALPRDVAVEVTSSAAPPYKWRIFWLGEMTDGGLLDTGERGTTLARRVRLTIRSAWGQGPVGIESVRVD